MSIVKYKLNNGKIAVYESTSYYDSEKKQTRPKRKYLRMEDTETGELIPSSKREARAAQQGKLFSTRKTFPLRCHQAAEASKKLEQEVEYLAEENRVLREQNEVLRKEVSRSCTAVDPVVALLNAFAR